MQRLNSEWLFPSFFQHVQPAEPEVRQTPPLSSLHVHLPVTAFQFPERTPPISQDLNFGPVNRTHTCAFFRHLPAKLQVSFQHCPCPDTHRCFKAQNTRVKIRWKGAFSSGGPPILSPTDSIQNTALTYSIQGARTICCTHTLGEMLRTKVKSLDQLHPAAAVCWTGQFYTATPRAAGAVLLPAAIQNKPQGAAGQPELLRWSARNFWAFWPLKWSDSDTAESLHTAGKTKHKVRTLDFCYSPKSG